MKDSTQNIIKMWNSTKTKNGKPTAGIPVIAFGKNEHGKDRIIRAFYAPRFTIEDDNEYEAAEYSEEKECYFLREGWYESNEHDEVNWMVCFEITHWMPLPDAPYCRHPQIEVRSVNMQDLDGKIIKVEFNVSKFTPGIVDAKEVIIRCPECLGRCERDELDTFGGLCEECSGAFDEEYWEREPNQWCEKCGRTYDDYGYEYQYCEACGWDADKKKFDSI